MKIAIGFINISLMVCFMTYGMDSSTSSIVYLAEAIKKGNPQEVGSLLEEGVNPNAQGEWTLGALDVWRSKVVMNFYETSSVSKENIEIYKMLKKKGAQYQMGYGMPLNKDLLSMLEN
jgi:hypothetical protein